MLPPPSVCSGSRHRPLLLIARTSLVMTDTAFPDVVDAALRPGYLDQVKIDGRGEVLGKVKETQ